MSYGRFYVDNHRLHLPGAGLFHRLLARVDREGTEMKKFWIGLTWAFIGNSALFGAVAIVEKSLLLGFVCFVFAFSAFLGTKISGRLK